MNPLTYDSTTCSGNYIVIDRGVAKPKGKKRNHPTVEQRRKWREDAFRRARCR